MSRHKNFLNYFRRYDEYYTRYEHVKDIFERYIPKDEIKDKIIYCPCDSDKSNFVIYLKEHKDDLGYKELIYTCDDYNTHIDLFEKADIIITNPPFSKLIREFIPILNKVNKKFFIFGSMISLPGYITKFTINNIRYVRSDKYFDFIMSKDCNLANCPLYVYISNLDIKDYYPKPKFNKPKKGIETNLGYINYDKLNNIPIDEKRELLVPVTVYLEHNRKYFDILEGRCLKNLKYSDDKDRYSRIVAKRKPINII